MSIRLALGNAVTCKKNLLLSLLYKVIANV